MLQASQIPLLERGLAALPAEVADAIAILEPANMH